MRYDRVLSFALEHPWALTAEHRAYIAARLAERLVAKETDPAVIEAAVSRRRSGSDNGGASVAVIPIHGVIAPRMNLLSEMSGGATCEGLSVALAAAVAAPAVKTIVLDVDSPGGNVAGATEFAREVLAARTRKTVIAVAEHLMCSAAYWIGACATEVVAAPSAMVGSIGVYTIHEDLTEALRAMGITREIITAGKYKTELEGPLTEEGRAHLQSLVNQHYARFVGDVARGRGVKASEVRKGFGEGRGVSAADARALGMVDRVESLGETLARLGVRRRVPDPLPEAPSEEDLLDAPEALSPDTSQEPLEATDQDRRSSREEYTRSLALLDL